MKKGVILLFFLCLFSCDTKDAPETPEEPVCTCEELQRELPWDYPVKPGTDEWRAFKTSQEMVDVCQIPDEVLTSLSTEDLTDICLNYPLWMDVFRFNYKDDGLNKFFSDFNGIRELYERKEAAGELLKRYDKQLCWLDWNKGEFSTTYSVAFLERLFTRLHLQSEEDKEILKKILQSLVAGYEIQRNIYDEDYAYHFYMIEFQDNFYSRAHIIHKMGKLTPELHYLVCCPSRANAEMVKLLDELSYQLIK
jgi:hypothetical protein